MFATAPVLRVLPAPDKWELREELVWESQEVRFRIPTGWITDLASIPRPLRNALNVNGRSRCPALAHDWLYNTQRTSRAFADEVFRRALIAYGMRACEARVYWLGVRAGGWIPWRRRLAQGGGLQPSDFSTTAAYRHGLAVAADLEVPATGDIDSAPTPGG